MGKDMSWLIGVGINLVGSILINLGTNVMKLGHNKRAAMDCPEASKPPISRFRAWQIGVAAFSVGNVANFLSFGYAAQSLLAAIGCVQFVSNVIFASLVLKEQVTKPILAATAAIVGGCILLVSFGSHSSRSYNMGELLGLYNEPAYVAYLVVGAAVVVASYGVYWKGRRAVRAAGGEASGVWAALLPVLYSVFSAIIGTQSVLFSKTLAVLLRATFNGDNQLTKWFTYVVVPVFLFSAAFWVTRLNKGLRMFPAMIIVPTLQIAWTLFSIVSGMLYFQEYRGLSALDASMFALGVTIVFLGVFLLTKSTARSGPSAAELAAAEKMRLVYATFEDEAVPSRRTTFDTIKALRMEEEEEEEAEQEEAAKQTGGARAAAALASPGSTPRSPVTPHLGVEDAAAEAAAAAAEAAGSASKPMPPVPLPGGGRQAVLDAGGWDEFGQGSLLERGFNKERRRQLRRAVNSLQRRMRIDFDLDEGTAAKLMMGLGDEALPAVSLFAPPMVDYHTAATAKVTSYGALCDRSIAGGAHSTALSAMPSTSTSFTSEAGPLVPPGHPSSSQPPSMTHQRQQQQQQHQQRQQPQQQQPQQQQQQRQQHQQLQSHMLAAAAVSPVTSDSGGPPGWHGGRSSEPSGRGALGINPLSNAHDVKPVAARPASPLVDNFMSTVELASRNLRDNIRATLAQVQATSQQHLPHQLLHPGSHGRGKAYARAGRMEQEGDEGEEEEEEEEDDDSAPMLNAKQRQQQQQQQQQGGRR